ncbi:MAG: Permease subunit MlaE of the ABC-type intermembrane phospholipid transporter Mla [Thermodesulfobacterium sp.]|uniref:Permease subunit MlaE of the ABC-type intermembrane phospholipid transporter Mla n=1 Tax=Candidatus Thermodesulfobacterium syntrophicum TaxID=3060442 RepID=A0AAE3P4T4_9BACT|nr:Permease subunit MlaE of the ABC-type intermembrane phospholipid transporter Mla [Candidatus Thermodesulfobacterium syntrophicum]
MEKLEIKGKISCYELEKKLKASSFKFLDITKLEDINTCLLLVILKELKNKKLTLNNLIATNKQLELIHLLEKYLEYPKETKSISKKPISLNLKHLFYKILAPVEYLGYFLVEAFKNIRQMEFSALLKDLQVSGAGTLLLLGALSFLLGIVMAYQSAFLLRTFGANIFIVELIGIPTFRELAPIITGILLAGRVASGYSANIGLRKVSEELDALEVMGLSWVSLLVLPRVLSLIISAPILMLFSSFFMILGGALISEIYLNIPVLDFFSRLPEAVSSNHVIAGIIKMPFFGLYTALVGCYFGYISEKNPQSLANSVMKSVVYCIAGVIVMDAIFSIIFTKVGL